MKRDLEKKIITQVFKIIDEEIGKFKVEYDYIILEILTAFRTVGVQGDKRTYSWPFFIRISKDKQFIYPIKPGDDLRASPGKEDFLKNISTRIPNEVEEINRVVYDITPV